MSHYSHHVFFCCNQRTNGERCCNDHAATEVRDYAKAKIKELNLNGPGKVRVNMAGCMDRCDDGPVMVDCMVSKEANCFPMIPSGAAHTEMLLYGDQVEGTMDDEAKALV